MNRMIIAVLIPIVGLFSWVIRLQRGVSTGHEVRLGVTGYDPRDLLAGHYVQYRVDFDMGNVCENPSEPGGHCVCLAFFPETKRFVGHWAGRCEERPADVCSKYFIRGTCEQGRFEAGIERYYIPEAYSSVLMTIPDDTSISVMLDGNGSAQVTGLFVGDRPVDVYAREELAKRPPTELSQ